MLILLKRLTTGFLCFCSSLLFFFFFLFLGVWTETIWKFFQLVYFQTWPSYPFCKYGDVWVEKTVCRMTKFSLLLVSTYSTAILNMLTVCKLLFETGCFRQFLSLIFSYNTEESPSPFVLKKQINTVHSEIFSQTLFDFKRMVSHSISPKFSGKIPYVLSKPQICFLGSKDKIVLF